MKEAIKKAFNYIIENIKSKMNDTKTSSRKYKLILLIFFAATLMCLLPPILSQFVFKTSETLVIISGTEWVTVMSMLSGFYLTSNVVQKQIVKPNNNTEKNNTD